ncbi:hypothetical protein D8B26_003930 [Coccidioides posadasii str. Silveira]|uniref:Uncharacterized protein n=1 Tax=Coccidioides posadasii (strain RMSCC 757 / Silveira) TaxID=443226 RepID=E9D9F0_COCPS|nr:conserved hypothetical protein [Coccidioides posadasii str. Silveira]QVM09266.1 hypothetical protein D8B26_003930 [Coccidioides posadasii str. Silveira]
MTVVKDTQMQDPDLMDQWNQSRAGTFPDFKQDQNSNFEVRKADLVIQPLKAAACLEDPPVVIDNWPLPLNHGVSRPVGHPAFEQPITKLPEYSCTEFQNYGQPSCVSQWESDTSHTEPPFHSARFQPTAPYCFGSMTPFSDTDSLLQDQLHISDIHCLESSKLPPKLKGDTPQHPQTPWPVSTDMENLRVSLNTQYTPGFELAIDRVEDHATTQSFSSISIDGLFHRGSTASKVTAENTQSLRVNPPVPGTETPDTMDIRLNSGLQPSEFESCSPIGSLGGLSNDRRQLCVSGGLWTTQAKPALQVRQISCGQATGVTVLKGSSHSGKRKSLIAAVQHRTSSMRPKVSEREERRGDGTSIRSGPKHRLPFQIVQEDGRGGSLSCSSQVFPIARARRQGPLSADGRRDAALRRKDKSVCIWCRLSKKKCSGENPCTACLEQAKSVIVEQPCVRADFFQIVESGTCNYISQRAVNHLTLDGSSRRRMELPSAFDMDHFVSQLEKRQGEFNIRVQQAWRTLFVLDLREVHIYLKTSQGKQKGGLCDLRDFIDNHILKFNNWQRCVKECNPIQDVLSLLSQWNNMPSRASYYFAFHSDNIPDCLMNIEDPNDQIEILLAAQLSRIFCRKLEVDGYRALQCILNKNKWDDTPYDSFLKFVLQLGRILVSLRWRVSWWELLGDGGLKPDINKERYEDRVRNLCKVLYFYYTSVKLKLPSWMAPDQLDGVWSTYADANKVWDDFPSMATAEGFEAWMARGKQLIKEAGVRNGIPSI